MNSIAGIGSRETPEEILVEMELIGKWILENRSNELIVNTGHADGADYAFEKGAQRNARVFLPWKGFNDKLPYFGTISVVNGNHDTWVDKYHPAPQNLTRGARLLMSRNVCQVLGPSLNEPVKAVIAWTPNGALKGGTAFAIRIAMDYNIPIYNMFFDQYNTSTKVIQSLLDLGL